MMLPDPLPQAYYNVGGHKKYDDNTLTVAQLEYYEAKGCILFPCFGCYTEHGTANDLWNETPNAVFASDGPEGTYWSSTYSGTNQSYTLHVKTGYYYTGCYVYPGGDSFCDRKLCVRLVCPYGTPYKYDIDQM